MKEKELEEILERVRSGAISIPEALERLKYFPLKELQSARLDYHRELRTGYPEVVYCAGKSIAHLEEIFDSYARDRKNVIGTRATPEMYEAVQRRVSEAMYYPLARIISLRYQEIQVVPDTAIGVLWAGTADLPIAEEAAVTAELLGNRVERFHDIGIAGVHRLLDALPKIKRCRVLIVVAGMEGALPSVLGGLVHLPLIAVPTSVGYGANFGGLSALLGMLTSCAPGITVVNIDNGFGAALAASRINHL